MFKEFIKKIENHQTIGVLSHVRPDGDCIGSQVALCRWLQKKGFEVYGFNDDQISQNMQWLLEYFPIIKPTPERLDKCDLFILLDGNALHRFGSFKDWYEDKSVPLLMVDHHPNPEDVFDIAISVDHASSTCELIYRLYEETDLSLLDEKSSKALYTGIITDTGGLKFDSVKPETVEVVADLLRRGKFTPNEVIEKLFYNKTLPQMRLLSLALGNINLYEDGQICVMSITQKMLDDTGTTNADCEGFVDYPLSISGVKAAILIKDLNDDGIKMSIRSKSHVDVNKWARELGGGGHKKAAGAWHKGPLDKAIADTVKIGSKQLEKVETTTLS